MLQVSEQALRDGCERAQDLFKLNRLRGQEQAAESFDAVFSALGVTMEMRNRLHEAIDQLVPIRGVPGLDAGITVSMVAGVLVGLLIADSTMPADELDLPIRLT